MQTAAHLVQGWSIRGAQSKWRVGAGPVAAAGLVTSAAESGANADRIMDYAGHASVAMERVYTRRSDAFADHAGDVWDCSNSSVSASSRCRPGRG